MNKKINRTKSCIENIASTDNINERVFIGLVILCFIGDVIGEVSDHTVIIYWLLMTPLFFLASTIIEKSQSIKKFGTSKSHFRFSTILWGSAFFSVLNIMFLWHAEVLAIKTVGLIIHVILAHTFLVSGTFLGARFYLIGLLLLVLAWFTIAMEAIVGMGLLIIAPLIMIGLHYKNKTTPPRTKKNQISKHVNKTTHVDA